MAYLDPRGKIFLTHSPSGVRVEFCAAADDADFFGQGLLELWLSPRADSDMDCRIRNFSNRDDPMRLFDRIAFPGLGADAFERCDYDAFRLVLRYPGGQNLHIVPLVRHAGVVLWADKAQAVDFKLDRTDARLDGDALRSIRRFGVRHGERGELFDFLASLGDGDGAFIHQFVGDIGRSLYARANLEPGQLVSKPTRAR